MRNPFCLFTVLALVVVSGCGRAKGVPRAAVSGNVTCDGEPIASGTVLFVPGANVDGPPVQAIIENGTYELSADQGPVIGVNSVQVTAMKKTGKKTKTIMNEEADEVIQFVAPRFNEESELTAEVGPGNNQLNFDVSSK
jgi:hypothetical protein